MIIKLTISSIRGLGLIWYKHKYHALWLEWADGGLAMPDGKLKPIYITPRLRYVHT